MNIQTSRLSLVAATARLVSLEIDSPDAFGQALGVNIPDNWPPALLVDALPWFLKQLEADPALSGWLCWYGVCQQTEDGQSWLVGSAGFMGPPQEGTVEIGYSVLPQFQGQGYAAEMVGGLVDWALSQPNVGRVVAEASSENKPSLRVLAKQGFSLTGAGREAGHLRFERTLSEQGVQK